MPESADVLVAMATGTRWHSMVPLVIGNTKKAPHSLTLKRRTLKITITLRPCPHVGNFNFAIWRQRDKEMFFCKKNCQLKKNVQHSSAIFFSHRCQQCFLNLKDCQIVFKSFIQYFSPKTYLAHGFWHIIHQMAKLPKKNCKG